MARPNWQLSIALDDSAELPVFLQLARAIADDIRRGRLKPDQRLPSSRGLADVLRVHRNTILAAYNELIAEGWLETRPARGTFVSADMPETRPRRFAKLPVGKVLRAKRPGYDLGDAQAPARGTRPASIKYPLMGGLPDMRLIPETALARAYRRAVRHRGSALLDYTDPQGHPPLREAILNMLRDLRGIVAEPDELLLTRGSQMALYLAGRVLIEPGDVVFVESFGYGPAWQALRMSGAKLIAIPVDEAGMNIDAFVAAADKTPPRAVYLTPHHQFPTTATLSPGRRLRLLELARRRRFAILEDDYDHEFHYDGRPIQPLASADTSGSVVYVGTLSKVLAPGLRIGYAVAPRAVIERMVNYRSYVDSQGDAAVEAAVAELFEDGEMQRHVGRSRRIYRDRREALVHELTTRLGDVVEARPSNGGLALWAKVARGIDVNAWAERALAAGVAFSPANLYTFDRRRRPFARFGFATCTEDELVKAVKILRRTLPSRR